MAHKKIYDPNSKEPFKLSRSKLELFIECPRCFYLDRRCGIARPRIPAFTLNSAVDCLLKKEFDHYRQQGLPHPLMQEYGIDAIPFAHPQLEQWRANFIGIQVHHPQTNFIFYGAIDDVWAYPNSELAIVDYKSTSTQEEIVLEGKYKEAYKRQMEIYQWLFRKNGFKVSNTGYFVYANALKTEPNFSNTLKFKTIILPYTGDATWVEEALQNARQCLQQSTPPTAQPNCEYCAYHHAQ